MKLQRFRKVGIWNIGWLVHQIYSLYEVPKLKQNFRKNNQLLAKLRSFWQVYFEHQILFVLKLASDRVLLYGNLTFSILLLSTKMRYSNFFKKVYVFENICFKVEVQKTFNISSDWHIKTCQSLKRRAILKIPSTVFQKNLYSFCWT